MEREPSFHRVTQAGYGEFRRRRILEAVFLGAAALLPIVALGVGLGMILRYHPVSGWLVPLAGVAGLGVAVFLALRFSMRHRLRYPEFLRSLERRLGLQENELINAGEMEQRLPSIPDPLTRGLAALTVERGAKRLEGVSFRRLAPVLSLKRPALMSVGSVLLGALLFLVSPASFSSSAGRFLRPGSFDLPPALAILVEPGNATLERGASVAVRARLPKVEDSVQLYHRVPGGAWKTLDMAPEAPGSATQGGHDAGDRAAVTAAPGTRSAYSASLTGIMEVTEYAVASGRARSETYRLRLIEPLRATGYQKRVEFPAYTGLNPIQEVALDGNLAGLIGSRATLTVFTSRPGAKGRLLPVDGQPIPLESAGKEGLTVTLPVRESMEFRVELTASDETAAQWRSEPFRLEAAADRPPTIFQLAPDRSIKLPPEMAVQLDVDCLDDFGLTRLDLVYRRNDGEAQRQRLSTWNGARDARVLHPWNLEEVASVPGDVIRYHLELTDNDVVTGPKTTKGPECEIRFPSLDEMYAEVEDERRDQMTEVREALEDQEELAKDLKSIQNDMKQSKSMRWEQQEQLKDLANRQQKVAERIDEMSESLERSLDRMEQSNLFTPEMLDKVQQINQMVRDIQSPEFQKYMEKLQEAIEKLDRTSVNKALENMQLTQQDLMRSLERTLEMLQQIKREETLDRMIEQAERLLQEQKQLNEQMQSEQPKEQSEQSEQDQSEQQQSEQQPSEQQQSEQNKSEQADQKGSDEGEKQAEKDAQKQADQEKSAEAQKNDQQQDQQMTPEEAQKLKEKQQALKEELAKLQKQLEELRKEAEQKWQALQQQMQEKQSEQKLGSAQKQMDSASQSMSKGKKKDSLKFGRQAEKDLEQFAEGMRQAQQAMQGADQEELTRKLYNLAGQLVRISQEQEDLLQQGPALSTRELALEQQRLSEGGKKTLDELYELARQSRFITPELGRIMGEAVRRLQESERAFAEGNRPSGMSGGREASRSLDQTVLALLQTNEQMCNSNCSGGSQNPLSRMRSLAGQQESLNQDMQGMMGQSQGGSRLSSGGGQGERLAQMAARQEMIRRGLQEVQGTVGERSDILGRLDDLGKEMEEVVQEMRSRDVDERILKRQEKILSRLLTAQRSLRKEGEKEERVSRPGMNPADRQSPPPIAGMRAQEEGLRRGILRGAQDPVPSEFRRLVETYFRSLGDTP